MEKGKFKETVEWQYPSILQYAKDKQGVVQIKEMQVLRLGQKLLENVASKSTAQ